MAIVERVLDLSPSNSLIFGNNLPAVLTIERYVSAPIQRAFKKTIGYCVLGPFIKKTISQFVNVMKCFCDIKISYLN